MNPGSFEKWCAVARNSSHPVKTGLFLLASLPKKTRDTLSSFLDHINKVSDAHSKRQKVISELDLELEVSKKRSTQDKDGKNDIELMTQVLEEMKSIISRKEAVEKEFQTIWEDAVRNAFYVCNPEKAATTRVDVAKYDLAEAEIKKHFNDPAYPLAPMITETPLSGGILPLVSVAEPEPVSRRPPPPMPPAHMIVSPPVITRNPPQEVIEIPETSSSSSSSRSSRISESDDDTPLALIVQRDKSEKKKKGKKTKKAKVAANPSPELEHAKRKLLSFSPFPNPKGERCPKCVDNGRGGYYHPAMPFMERKPNSYVFDAVHVPYDHTTGKYQQLSMCPSMCYKPSASRSRCCNSCGKTSSISCEGCGHGVYNGPDAKSGSRFSAMEVHLLVSCRATTPRQRLEMLRKEGNEDLARYATQEIKRVDAKTGKKLPRKDSPAGQKIQQLQKKLEQVINRHDQLMSEQGEEDRAFIDDEDDKERVSDSDDEYEEEGEAEEEEEEEEEEVEIFENEDETPSLPTKKRPRESLSN